MLNPSQESSPVLLEDRKNMSPCNEFWKISIRRNRNENSCLYLVLISRNHSHYTAKLLRIFQSNHIAFKFCKPTGRMLKLSTLIAILSKTNKCCHSNICLIETFFRKRTQVQGGFFFAGLWISSGAGPILDTEGGGLNSFKN